MASEQLQKVLELARAMQAQLNAPLAEMRKGFEAGAEPVAPDVKCEPVNAGGVKAEWITAPGADSNRVVFYLHGGGYVMGSINTHRAMVARISRASRARALAIDYRLAPEHPFPAAVDDAVAAYRWLLSQGVDPRRIAISGDSAGGGLTLATLVALRNAKVALPACAVPISPWTDMEGTGASITTRANADPLVQKQPLLEMAKRYVGSADPRNPLASPLHADLLGLPPMLIHVGDAEVLLDDSTRVAEHAKSAGVKVTLEVWPDMIHVWHSFAMMLPEGQGAIDRIGEFIRAQTA
jgi:monoterpene epsilon-lactone hydrolase